MLTVVLDGENAWGTFVDDARPFLHALYRLLEQDAEVATAIGNREQRAGLVGEDRRRDSSTPRTAIGISTTSTSSENTMFCTLMRRQHTGQPSVLTFSDLTLDMSSHKVWRGQREVVLTSLEFKLLQTFSNTHGRCSPKTHCLSGSGAVTLARVRM